MLSNNNLKQSFLNNAEKCLKKDIKFREVKMQKDLNRLHEWMNNEHVIPYWKLNISLDLYKEHLENALNDNHQKLYIGYIKETPMSYWERYWVNGDIIRDYYKYDKWDQGIHLLIGPKEFISKGYSVPLLLEMLRLQFTEKKTKKIVAEPDIRNEKMIHVFKKCGFQPVKNIILPDKEALLMFCERNRFERIQNNVK
jgi:acetyl CoA:N6-hydroxylysine acetyl transferase